VALLSRLADRLPAVARSRLQASTHPAAWERDNQESLAGRPRREQYGAVGGLGSQRREQYGAVGGLGSQRRARNSHVTPTMQAAAVQVIDATLSPPGRGHGTGQIGGSEHKSPGQPS